MSNNPVISFNNVTVSFEGRPVLKDVNFTLENGEFMYLIGPTGAGKSSFLKLIYRDILPDSGSVWVAGEDVTQLKDRKIPYLRRKLGIVFQDFHLMPDRNVYDNVAFALEVTNAGRFFMKQRILEVLSMVGLSHRKTAMPDDLSGGEQQRVVIARALANEPRILLADEPTGNLDPDTSRDIVELLNEINNRGMAVLMVTHHYDLVREYPARTVKINRGNLVELNPEQVGI